jgi:hypothetical protein
VSTAVPTTQPVSSLELARLSVSCGDFARSLAGRFVAALGAETNLPVDRLDEAILVGEAVADRSCEISPDGELDLAVALHSDRLEMRVGPLDAGAATRLLGSDTQAAAHGGAIRGLATSVEIRRLRTGKVALHIVIAPTGRPTPS